MPTLAERLRAAIADRHTAIERTPFAVAMIRAELTRPAYAVALRQLAHVHEALEDVLENQPVLADLYDHTTMARSAAAAADSEYLGGDPNEPLVREAEALGELFHSWNRQPWQLLGALYVFEGSRMGSMMIAKPLAVALGVPPVPGHGLDYHLDGSAGRPANWGRFKAAVSALPLSEPDQDAVVAGATGTMSLLCELYAVLPTTTAVTH